MKNGSLLKRVLALKMLLLNLVEFESKMRTNSKRPVVSGAERSSNPCYHPHNPAFNSFDGFNPVAAVPAESN